MLERLLVLSLRRQIAECLIALLAAKVGLFHLEIRRGRRVRLCDALSCPCAVSALSNVVVECLLGSEVTIAVETLESGDVWLRPLVRLERLPRGERGVMLITVTVSRGLLMATERRLLREKLEARRTDCMRVAPVSLDGAGIVQSLAADTTRVLTYCADRRILLELDDIGYLLISLMARVVLLMRQQSRGILAGDPTGYTAVPMTFLIHLDTRQQLSGVETHAMHNLHAAQGADRSRKRRRTGSEGKQAPC